MKILYIITQSSGGGAQKYVETLALNLAKKENTEVIIAGGAESVGELARKLSQAGLKFIPLRRLMRRISPLNDLLAVWEIKALVEREKPDIVHLNSSKAGAVGSLGAKMARHKTKVIYTVHGWVFNENLNWPVKLAYFLIEKFFSSFKDKFICISEADRKIGLIKKIAPAKKFIVIYNGLALPDDYFLDRDEARQKLGLNVGDEATVIGTIANFYPTKGLKYLVEAIDRLANNHHLPIKAVIIGEGELRTELEAMITDLNLKNNIILTGTILEAGKYLKALDIAAIPSVKEGVPYFLLEAMSAGLPIVATRVGGIPEIIIEGENGFLVESKNPKMLADRIKRLTDDFELRNNMSAKNRAAVKEKFSLPKMIEKTFQIYSEYSK